VLVPDTVMGAPERGLEAAEDAVRSRQDFARRGRGVAGCGADGDSQEPSGGRSTASRPSARWPPPRHGPERSTDGAYRTQPDKQYVGYVGGETRASPPPLTSWGAATSLAGFGCPPSFAEAGAVAPRSGRPSGAYSISDPGTTSRTISARSRMRSFSDERPTLKAWLCTRSRGASRTAMKARSCGLVAAVTRQELVVGVVNKAEDLRPIAQPKRLLEERPWRAVRAHDHEQAVD
jgi:hypothetical protein